MDAVKEKVEELVAVIKESTEYEGFQAARRQVDQVPGLADRIRKFCWENYELQNSDAEDMHERLEEFEAQYQEFREKPMVQQYLEYELRMCRMLQEINARIMDVVDLMI